MFCAEGKSPIFIEVAAPFPILRATKLRLWQIDFLLCAANLQFDNVFTCVSSRNSQSMYKKDARPSMSHKPVQPKRTPGKASSSQAERYCCEASLRREACSWNFTWIECLGARSRLRIMSLGIARADFVRVQRERGRTVGEQQGSMTQSCCHIQPGRRTLLSLDLLEFMQKHGAAGSGCLVVLTENASPLLQMKP